MSVILIIAILAVVAIKYTNRASDSDMSAPTSVSLGKDKRDIALQVESFGMHMKNVSLLSPTVAADIEREYGPYLSTSLLTSWISHPERAAGRETSSPWPERIDVIEMEREENGTWEVRAMLVFMTSEEVAAGGNAGTATVSMSVIQEEETWKIDHYEVVRTNNPNAPLGEGDLPKLE